MAEKELEPPLLGVAWDGTGYGTDGTIWGGEFFHVRDDACVRVAHLHPFRLPGGEKAVKEPRRSALGLLYECFGNAIPGMSGLPALRDLGDTATKSLIGMLERGINCPMTSSAGRLFDAVAALIDLRQRSRFEGQAAMELEFAVSGFENEEAYPIAILNSGNASEPAPAMVLDWGPMIESILADVKHGVAAGVISVKFHNALAEAVVTIANCVGEERVALSGGCFQNRYLTERVVRRLRAEGFRPYWHQRVPPNDGGIALGQVAVALRENRKTVCA
jgi:hydrogenase maturation protein HypF